MTRSDPQYRLFLLILILLTLLFLAAAILALRTLPSTETNQSEQSAEQATSLTNQIDKPIQSSITTNRSLLQANDLQQFNRLLFSVASQRSTQNNSERPIPYLVEEEGQHSIIYLPGKVGIRCWLEVSNNKAVGSQCQWED